MTEPVTFTEPAYLLMHSGLALTKKEGHLAIFTTKGVADHVAGINRGVLGIEIEVQPVTIRPVGQAHPPAPEVLNPDSPMLQQLDGHWQRLAAVLVWKLAKDGVTLTLDDLAQFPQDMVLLTHGHKDSIEYKLVTREAAERIAAHDRAQRGRA